MPAYQVIIEVAKTSHETFGTVIVAESLREAQEDAVLAYYHEVVELGEDIECIDRKESNNVAVTATWEVEKDPCETTCECTEAVEVPTGNTVRLDLDDIQDENWDDIWSEPLSSPPSARRLGHRTLAEGRATTAVQDNSEPETAVNTVTDTAPAHERAAAAGVPVAKYTKLANGHTPYRQFVHSE